MVKLFASLVAFLVGLLGLQRIKTNNAKQDAARHKAEAEKATSANQAYKYQNELRKKANEIEQSIATRSSRDERVRKYDRKS